MVEVPNSADRIRRVLFSGCKDPNETIPCTPGYTAGCRELKEVFRAYDDARMPPAVRASRENEKRRWQGKEREVIVISSGSESEGEAEPGEKKGKRKAGESESEAEEKKRKAEESESEAESADESEDEVDDEWTTGLDDILPHVWEELDAIQAGRLPCDRLDHFRATGSPLHRSDYNLHFAQLSARYTSLNNELYGRYKAEAEAEAEATDRFFELFTSRGSRSIDQMHLIDAVYRPELVIRVIMRKVCFFLMFLFLIVSLY